MIPYSTHPILFQIGNIKFYTYGLMTAIAFIVGYNLIINEGNRKKLNLEQYKLMPFWILIGALLGARIYYIYEYGGNFFKIWEGGLVFFGSFIGAFIAFFIYAKINKVPVRETLDVFFLAIPLMHAIGRVGCYFRGCCYGLPMQKIMPWGVNYLGAIRHPTQLYSIIMNLAIFFILLNVGKKDIRGLVTSLYLMLYPLGRFFLEFVRVNPRDVFGLTSAQFTSIFVFLIGATYLGIIIYEQVKGPEKSKTKKNRAKKHRK